MDFEPSVSYIDLQASSSMQKAEMARNQIHQVVALAVISRLHEWCLQLLRITLLCVMSCCEPTSANSTVQTKQQQEHRKKKSIADIEMKLLRHLTSPTLQNLRPVQRNQKRKQASRPPSPQLFDIVEEEL